MFKKDTTTWSLQGGICPAIWQRTTVNTHGHSFGTNSAVHIAVLPSHGGRQFIDTILWGVMLTLEEYYYRLAIRDLINPPRRICPHLVTSPTYLETFSTHEPLAHRK